MIITIDTTYLYASYQFSAMKMCSDDRVGSGFLHHPKYEVNQSKNLNV